MSPTIGQGTEGSHNFGGVPNALVTSLLGVTDAGTVLSSSRLLKVCPRQPQPPPVASVDPASSRNASRRGGMIHTSLSTHES
ncbi:hypothetical protein E2C01_022291 [Portunus trituberculatus]|uniref:Uncharacterized protein n=1 Tax=Portunus trituberculatus TaxID=210409 RepID=A0A5B7E7A3_PORTR|nr:hypothetical protein [Portunus trituberculatus]